MLCAFISSTSRRMTSLGSARPRSGSHSWRLTPRSSTRRPLTRSSPSSTATRAEADPQRHGLPRRAQLAGVEPRQLGAPRLDGPGRDRLTRVASIPSSGTTTARRHVGVDAQRAVGGARARTGRRRSPPGGRAARRRGTAPTATTCPGPPGSCPQTTGAPHLEHVLGPQQVPDRELVHEPAAARLAELDRRSATPAGASPRRRSAAPRRPRASLPVARTPAGTRPSGSRRARTAGRPGTDRRRSCTRARRARAAASARAPAARPSGPPSSRKPTSRRATARAPRALPRARRQRPAPGRERVRH